MTTKMVAGQDTARMRTSRSASGDDEVSAMAIYSAEAGGAEGGAADAPSEQSAKRNLPMTETPPKGNIVAAGAKEFYKGALLEQLKVS